MKKSEQRTVKIVLGLLLTIASLPLLLSLLSMGSDHLSRAQQSPSPLPPLARIRLGENVSSVGGLGEWPKQKDGRSNAYNWFRGAANIQLNLPSGRQLSYQALNVSLAQDNEIVSSVLIRLSPVTDDYLEALNNLEAELNKLSSQSREKCAAKLDELRKGEEVKTSAREHLGCAYDVEKNVLLRAGVEWSLDLKNTERNWRSFLQFSLKDITNGR